MKIITIEHDTIQSFKQSWPCHGIPSDVDHIVVAFNGGDLVDYEAFDEDDWLLYMDGSEALSALFKDAERGHRTRIIPGTIGPICTY